MRLPILNGVFDHRKPRFSKMVPRVEIFENGDFPYTSGRTKTELFEYRSSAVMPSLRKWLRDSRQVVTSWASLKFNTLYAVAFYVVTSPSWVFTEVIEHSKVDSRVSYDNKGCKTIKQKVNRKVNFRRFSASFCCFRHVRRCKQH